SVLLSAANFGITDPDATSFTYSVSSVTHGSFQTSTDGIHWTDATTFTSAQLAGNHVRFHDDGSDLAPTFSVQVDNGETVNHQSNLFAGTVTFIDAPPAPTVSWSSSSFTEESNQNRQLPSLSVIVNGLTDTLYSLQLFGIPAGQTVIDGGGHSHTSLGPTDPFNYVGWNFNNFHLDPNG